MKMPYAPVTDEGAVLYYEDSGTPAGLTDYVTIVAIHGTLFHSEVFGRVLPFATERGMRLVRINLRDYPGSTPLSKDAPGTAEEIIASMGQELAAFLAWFVEAEHLPEISSTSSADEKGTDLKGGLSILAWSMGNIPALSLLGNLDKVSQTRQDLLGKYVRSYVMLDPGCFVFGLPDPLRFENEYHPILDLPPTTPPSQLRDAFLQYVAGYHAHRLPDKEFSSMTRSEFVTGLGHSRTHPEMLPTVIRMSPGELKAVTDHAGGASPSHSLVRYADPSIFDATFRRALLDRAIWPTLRVEYTWCTMSIDETVYVAWFLAHVMHENEVHRKFTAHALKANHFPHWDQPEMFTAHISKIV